MGDDLLGRRAAAQHVDRPPRRRHELADDIGTEQIGARRGAHDDHRRAVARDAGRCRPPRAARASARRVMAVAAPIVA